MKISSIHSYLVHPAKHVDPQPPIRGTSVASPGKLYDMLDGVFRKAEHECQHDIAFTPDNPSVQSNECRDRLLAYLKSNSLADGRRVAESLQKVTTRTSGLGLLFLMAGHDGGQRKLVVSRFPADSGILAEEDERTLTVAFLERVFMKSMTAYKACVYSGRSLVQDFWRGKAVDKQVNSTDSSISSYWIRAFLKSDFLTPGEAGTRRLALAVREAVNRTTDIGQKEELAAFCRLVRSSAGKITSAKDLLETYGLSEGAREEVRKGFGREALFTERHRFVPAEFSKHVAFRTVELNNGGMLTAMSEKFDDVFRREELDPKKKIVKFTTQGAIVDEKLRKVKA